MSGKEHKKPSGEQENHINLKVEDLVRDFSISLSLSAAAEAEASGASLKTQVRKSARSEAAMSGEDDKKPSGEEANHIKLKVKGQDGNEVFFSIKRSSPLQKLMKIYGDRRSIDFKYFQFLFDGRMLRGEQTPEELELEDEDEIDAMLHQDGGGL